MNPHRKFIETSITNILKEAVQAINTVGSGIETYPLLDYVMQSVFIKMTGAQEQKMKCIAWELATNDFAFRQDFLKNFNVQFSEYKHKNMLYTELFEQINKVVKDFSLNEETRRNIRKSSRLKLILPESNLILWNNRDYTNYEEIWNTISINHFAKQPTTLLETNPLQKIYENHLYQNRNRIAHNTKSFQQNLPTLELLKSDDYQYENYFLWFSILILIDEIFMALYKEYLKTLEQKTFI